MFRFSAPLCLGVIPLGAYMGQKDRWVKHVLQLIGKGVE